MTLYPAQEMDITGIFKLSFKGYLKTLRYVLVFIFFLLASAYFPLVAIHFSLDPNVAATVSILLLAGCFYFLSTALWASHCVISGVPSAHSLKTVFKKLPLIAGTFIAYCVGISLFSLLMHYMVMLIHYLDPHTEESARNIARLLGFGFSVVFLCLFFFSYPLSVIDQKSFFKNFKNSMLLTEKNKFGILIFFFLVLLLHALLVTGRMHIIFLNIYYLNMLYDFILMALFVPVLINFLLFLINDSKQQL